MKNIPIRYPIPKSLPRGKGLTIASLKGILFVVCVQQLYYGIAKIYKF